jgi:hypothetical protein
MELRHRFLSLLLGGLERLPRFVVLPLFLVADFFACGCRWFLPITLPALPVFALTLPLVTVLPPLQGAAASALVLGFARCPMTQIERLRGRLDALEEERDDAAPALNR